MTNPHEDPECSIACLNIRVKPIQLFPNFILLEMKPMKKYTFFLVFLFNLLNSQSQVVFCPAGAEWHYSFIRFNLMPQYGFDNVPVTYLRDSIIGADTVRVLTHDRYFTGPNDYIFPSSSALTLIKQRGDTVFMRNNYTHHEWQILYNFACQPGQCWQTKISPGPLTSSNVSVYTFCVDSVKYIQHNGQSLKTLFIGSNLRVTERYGANSFLFPFDYSHLSDGDYFSEYLCYQDNTHGLAQFTAKPCNYSNLTGLVSIEEIESNMHIYPNPTHNKLILKSETKQAVYKIKLANALGQTVISEKTTLNAVTELDLFALENGIYILQVYETGTLIATKKIIKD